MWERIPPEIPPGLRRYLWIEGRSSRREWWQIEGVALVSYWFVGTGAGVLAELKGEPTLLPLQVRMLLGALMVWINFASTVRRLHDRNKSGWWGLLYLFPIFGIIWHFIECGLLPPRNQGNRYGPPERSNQSPFDQIAALAQKALIPAAPRPTMGQRSMQSAPMSVAPAHRASARGARPTRTIGPAAVSAVNRTRSPNKLILAIAAAAAIAVLATTLLTLPVTPVGVMEDAPVLEK
jgi:uncharacterized membrane protein YhaH (DUF805 family)